jgi:hypothetical protein
VISPFESASLKFSIQSSSRGGGNEDATSEEALLASVWLGTTGIIEDEPMGFCVWLVVECLWVEFFEILEVSVPSRDAGKIAEQNQNLQ